MNTHSDVREIARAVSISSLLKNFSWRVRNRKRADCGLCRGNSNGTIAFTDSLWKCHRCNQGGDAFALVRAANRCDFRTALRYVADLAGIRQSNACEANARTEPEAAHRRRIEQAEVDLANLERSLRIQIRDQIHECDGVLAVTAPWSPVQWRRARAAIVLRDSYLLPGYALLSFGPLAERARYALHPELRAEMATTIRHAGGVRADDNTWIEILQ